MRRARRKDSRTKKRLTVFFVSLLTVFTAFVLVLGFHSVLFPILDETIDGEYIEPVDKATGKINVLLLGVDEDGLRTDTIIFASYDLDDSKIEMLSIPRDTRMYIGGRFQKINAAHALTGKNGKVKGVDGTIEAVHRLTGMPINYYVEFSFDAFKNTIDALGGVEFDVPQRMKYSDPAQDLYIDLEKGLQLLDGDKAEQLVRFRQYPKGDIQRVETQQAFVKALAEQKLNLSILGNIPKLYETLKEDINTNFKLSDILKYVPNLKELSAENITMHQLPGDFSGPEYTASYWLVNMEELKAIVSDIFGYPEEALKATTGGDGVTDTGSDKAKATPTPTATPKENKSTTEKKNTSDKKTDTKKNDDVIEIPDKAKATPKPSEKPVDDTTETKDKTDSLKETDEEKSEKETENANRNDL